MIMMMMMVMMIIITRMALTRVHTSTKAADVTQLSLLNYHILLCNVIIQTPPNGNPNHNLTLPQP